MTKFALVHSSDTVVPQAGVVTLVNPNTPGLARSSLKSAKMFTRIVGPPIVSRPPISAVLYSPVPGGSTGLYVPLSVRLSPK